MVMRFYVLTLFPGAFKGPFDDSIVGRACQRGLISIQLTDIRAYTHDAHGTADDYQFGGGAGMVLKPEPIFEAVEHILSSYSPEERTAIPIILLSPQGKVLDQSIIEGLARAPAMLLICGHYSGVDERVRQYLATQEISIGDYVLTGGELAAMVLIDAVARFVPGVVGSPENVLEDSITSGLLQHPLYTRPAEYRGMVVPEVLRSGNHAEIARWRRHQALRRTLERRPDLLAKAGLTLEDLEFLCSLGYQRGSSNPQSSLPSLPMGEGQACPERSRRDGDDSPSLPPLPPDDKGMVFEEGGRAET
jgi:tRNA (guanine37-N1)-methyltransferase